jgi:hypothetical protein
MHMMRYIEIIMSCFPVFHAVTFARQMKIIFLGSTTSFLMKNENHSYFGGGENYIINGISLHEAKN